MEEPIITCLHGLKEPYCEIITCLKPYLLGGAKAHFVKSSLASNLSYGVLGGAFSLDHWSIAVQLKYSALDS